MATNKWTEEKSCKFVNVYEKYECLWNTKCNDYRNRDARVTAVRKVISDMEELGINMTEDEVKNRIKAIRTTYTADLRKVEKSAKSGVSVDDLYHPTCAWFKDADRFLRHVVTLRPVFENMRSESMKQVIRPASREGTSIQESKSQQAVVNEAFGDTGNTPIIIPPDENMKTNFPNTSSVRSNLKRLRRSSDDTSLSAINKLQKICDTTNESLKEDEFDIIGRHVANQLRNIVRAIEVQAQINTLLAKARIEDIKAKQIENSNQASQLQTITSDESSSSYWASPPYLVASESQHSYAEINVEQSCELSTKDILTQAINTIL